jgi:TRAP-type C4-dicarboxylate transport system substrate-binding protein
MMIAFRLNEVAGYVLRSYLTPAAVVIAINQDVFNEMPGDIQELMMKLGKQAQADTNQFFINVYQENYRTLAGVGVTTYNLPKSERDAWVKNLQPYCDELYSKMDADFARKLKEIGTKLDKEYPYKE